MTSTNYLSPQDFKKMINAIPLVKEYNNGKLLNSKRVPNPKNIQLCLWVQYCCALRISEVLRIIVSDFNFDNNISIYYHWTNTSERTTMVKCLSKMKL